jgi:hypothetical protein
MDVVDMFLRDFFKEYERLSTDPRKDLKDNYEISFKYALSVLPRKLTVDETDTVISALDGLRNGLYT